MENLSKVLSPLDDLELICEEHGIPCIGFCSNYKCKKPSKYFCMKCIKSGETCITKEKHELVSLSEIMFRFFINEENISNIASKVQEMEKLIKEYNTEEFNNAKIQYKIIAEDNKKFETIKTQILNIINEFIESCKSNNGKTLNNIKNEAKNQLVEDNEGLKLLYKNKIPDKYFADDNKELLISYINSQYKSTPANDLVNIIKFFNDSEKFMDIAKNINDKNYINEVTKLNDEKKKNLESKIDSIFQEFENALDQNLSKIEEEIILPKENPSIYTYYNMSLKFQNDPQELEFKEDICSTAHKTNSIDRVFCAFKSFSGESLVVWGSNSYSIEFYDCEKNQIIKTIPRAHNQTIFSCRHYQDLKQKIDYIITSSYDRHVKVWDCNKSFPVLSIPNAHTGYYIYSVCLLYNSLDESNYVITSVPNEKMKMWDFSGKYLKNFGQDNESTYFIDSYFDKTKKQYYILNANSVDVKSYEFPSGILYHRYKGTPQTWHMSVVVNMTKEGQILIESDGNGNIRMWDFHTAQLLKCIIWQHSLNLRGICLWNDKYLFASGNDYQVKLFDLEEGKFVKTFKGHTSTVCTIEKIMHPKYGGCMISQALDGKLKLWAPKQ